MPNLSRFAPKSVEGWLVIVIAALIFFFSVQSENFLTIRNFLDLAESYSVTGIFALGLFVVLITGGIDISFAAVASVTQYMIATFVMSLGIDSASVAILFCVLLGVGFGVLNAVLVYYFKIISIIVTISMQSVLFGLLMWSTNGRSLYDLPDWIFEFYRVLPFSIGGQEYIVGLPLAVLIVLAVTTWFILSKTSLGRKIYAAGGDMESARRIGIKVGGIHLLAYGFCGAMAAIGGLVQVYRMGEVVPNALVGSELNVLAAVVLGGASLSGGKGTVWGTLLGVFLVGMLNNGLNIIGVSNYFSDVAVGLVIIAAITITHYGKRRETNVGFS
ncbi:ABC transporter permease [Photobacterium sp. DNB22_13_2]